MPFKSKAQARKLFATNPKVAEEFAKHTPGGIKNLPERVDGSTGARVKPQKKKK
jgi:hypothetical protein